MTTVSSAASLPGSAPSSPFCSTAPGRRQWPSSSATRRSYWQPIPGSEPSWWRESSLIPNAIDELLRFEPPSPVQGRWTTQPVEMQGTTLPEGSKVLLLTGSAGSRRA